MTSVVFLQQLQYRDAVCGVRLWKPTLSIQSIYKQAYGLAWLTSSSVVLFLPSVQAHVEVAQALLLPQLFTSCITLLKLILRQTE